MNVKDRRAAVALRSAERPDVQTLRSALSRVERNFDNVLSLQDEEIQRLRRIIMAIVRAYRLMASADWKGSRRKLNAFVSAMDSICLEADAIAFSEDLKPKSRAVPRERKKHGRRAEILVGDSQPEGEVGDDLRPEAGTR